MFVGDFGLVGVEGSIFVSNEVANKNRVEILRIAQLMAQRAINYTNASLPIRRRPSGETIGTDPIVGTNESSARHPIVGNLSNETILLIC